jgi:hypothetical protein
MCWEYDFHAVTAERDSKDADAGAEDEERDVHEEYGANYSSGGCVSRWEPLDATGCTGGRYLPNGLIQKAKHLMETWRREAGTLVLK